MCTPSDAGLLSPRDLEPLEQVNWRAMSTTRLVLTLGAFFIALPMAVYRMSGSRLYELAALGSILFAPWLMTLSSPIVRRLRWQKRRRLAPAPLALTAGGEPLRGVVRACGQALRVPFVDGPCLAASWRARDGRGTYLWQLDSVDFDVMVGDAPVRVTGTLALDGAASPSRLPLELPVDVELPGEIELVVLHDGDEVELRGPVAREQVAAGYREAAEVDMMRGVPGRPIGVRRLAAATRA